MVNWKWSYFPYFPSISSLNGHSKFHRMAKITKLGLNPSRVKYFSNIFSCGDCKHTIFWWIFIKWPCGHHQQFQRYSGSGTGLHHAKIWLSVQVRCATTFIKNHSNGLKYVLKKYYDFLLSHFCFPFFGCHSEVKI